MPGSIACHKDFEHIITAYDAAVSYVDHQVGKERDPI